MRATIEFYATLRHEYGKKVDVDCDGTLRGALVVAAKVVGEKLEEDIFDQDGNFREDRIITVNGRNIRDEPIKEIDEGTRIAVFPPIAGG